MKITLKGNGAGSAMTEAGMTVGEAHAAIKSSEPISKLWETLLRTLADDDAKADDELIYAALVTGRMVTEQNQKFLTRKELDEWHDATNHFHEERERGVPASDLIAEAYRGPAVEPIRPTQQETASRPERKRQRLTQRPDGHYPQYWPELAERAERDLQRRARAEHPHLIGIQGGPVTPTWTQLEAESIQFRHSLLERIKQNLPVAEVSMDVADRQQFGTVVSPFPPERFDLRNIYCFQYLPSIIAMKEAASAMIDENVSQRGASRVQSRELQEQVRAEMAHSLYHQYMWRAADRRIYVLDRTTYNLLAHTPLPPLPASILSVPVQSFYLVLPPDAFEFGVWNWRTQTIDRQPIEGVLVGIDNTEPDSPFQREIAFMAVGALGDVGDRNIAFVSVALGADAKLNEVRPLSLGKTPVGPGYVTGVQANRPDMEGWASGANGGRELAIVLPRVILSLLLYLASEHPDIEPVPPAPRRAFKDIKSPKQRQAALDHQTDRLAGATRLPIFYIGGHLHEEVEAERERVEQAIAQDRVTGRTWTLDHAITVQGHWRQQPYGEGRTLRKLIWIRPYLKGPDMAASMKVHAAKIQRAQHTIH